LLDYLESGGTLAEGVCVCSDEKRRALGCLNHVASQAGCSAVQLLESFAAQLSAQADAYGALMLPVRLQGPADAERLAAAVQTIREQLDRICT
jgi:hypothetical protein